MHSRSPERAGPTGTLRLMSLTIQCLDVDAADPDRLATFWAAALGWRRTFGDEREVVLEPPAGSPQDGVAPDLLFLRVPEAKAGKNRLHLDLRPGGSTRPRRSRAWKRWAPAGSTSVRAPR